MPRYSVALHCIVLYLFIIIINAVDTTISSLTYVFAFRQLVEEETAMELFFPIVNASVMNVAPDVLLNLNSMSTLIKRIEPDPKTKSWRPSQSLAEIWYELAKYMLCCI